MFQLRVHGGGLINRIIRIYHRNEEVRIVSYHRVISILAGRFRFPPGHETLCVLLSFLSIQAHAYTHSLKCSEKTSSPDVTSFQIRINLISIIVYYSYHYTAVASTQELNCCGKVSDVVTKKGPREMGNVNIQLCTSQQKLHHCVWQRSSQLADLSPPPTATIQRQCLWDKSVWVMSVLEHTLKITQSRKLYESRGMERIDFLYVSYFPTGKFVFHLNRWKLRRKREKW